VSAHLDFFIIWNPSSLH